LTVLNIGEFELVFITDPGSHTVRCLTWEFDKSAGDFVYRLRTVAGLPMQAGFVDGDMKEAKFNSPMGVAGFVSQRKDISTQLPLPNQYEVYLYVADLNNHALRLVLLPVTVNEDALAADPRSKRSLQIAPSMVASVAGATPTTSGSGNNDSAASGQPAQFLLPSDVAVEVQAGSSHAVYVVDSGNHSIRRVEADAPTAQRLAQVVNVGTYKGTGSTYITWGSARRPDWVRPG
jgi:hypothetical protein